MKTFSAEELFRIIEVSQNFPLNLKFELKDFKTSFDFSDPIIYSILFDGKPIYIGYSFEAKQKDIRKSRWTKQLETILFRGYRVGLNKKAFLEFEKSLKQKLGEQDSTSIKTRITDVMTSSNRIIFASKYWEEIKKLDSNNDTFLKRISFQIEVFSKSIPKQDLQDRVNELIEQHKPFCNG
jgi:hypothetical protein